MSFFHNMIPLAQEGNASVLQQLDPPRRTAVIMALLGLALLGIVMVACVMFGAHWVRRLVRRGSRWSKILPGKDNKNWIEKPRAPSPTSPTDETLAGEPGSTETRLE